MNSTAAARTYPRTEYADPTQKDRLLQLLSIDDNASTLTSEGILTMKTVFWCLAGLVVCGCDAKEMPTSPASQRDTQAKTEAREQRDAAFRIAEKIEREIGAYAVTCDRLNVHASVYVNFKEEKVTDAALDRLAEFPQIGWLALQGKGITDVGLERIKGLTEIQTLQLHGNKSITDAGIKHLAGMTQMRWLQLSETQTTDAGLVQLRGMTKLEGLNLGQTKVTDAGLEQLVGLVRLDDLNVVGTKVTPEGLNKYKRAHQAAIVKELGKATINHEDPRKPVVALDLSDTLLNDVGLENVKRMKELEALDLSHTNVTDAGLHHLEGLSNLKSLNLRETRVSDVGVQRLRQALPKCKIVDPKTDAP